MNARKREDSASLKCPGCKQGILRFHRIVYDLPDGDKMLILRIECDKCDFFKKDVIPLTTKMEAGIMTLKVEEESDLRSKIYRSPTGKLEIPELELSVEPGPNADLYFTNVEGVLDRFKRAVSIYRNNLGEGDLQAEEVDEIWKDLEHALEGKLKFTLIIKDKGGGSYMIPVDDSRYEFRPFKGEQEDEEVD